MSMRRKYVTEDILRKLIEKIKHKNTYYCPEVTIGSKGNERVDLLTLDTEGIWRCYEVKSCTDDYYSNAKHTYVGHYNYMVIPEEYYDDVKEDIPWYVGVYLYRPTGELDNIKRSSKRNPTASEYQLSQSMIRSLYREMDKVGKCMDEEYLKNLNKQIRELAAEKSSINEDRILIKNVLYQLAEEYSIPKSVIAEKLKKER